MRLLIVEDQQDLNEIIVRKLTREGYSVDSCTDGLEACEYIESTDYDGIVMDIMLPGKTGLGILREMRAGGNRTPVLLLTAMGDVEDRVAGLDAGADDYLVKPFDFSELTARIRAMTRRSAGTADNVLRSGDLFMDRAAHRVTRGDREISLTAKEFEILEYLMQNPGIVLTRDKLSSHVWNYDYDGGSNVIDVYVHHLRKKIDGDFEDKKIVTVKGVGYKLV
ncbi:MAG: response regulator transcription factor [Clostridiales bacterium]|nr:response regulator transcription factor [Clostridiales bacterium]MDD7035344.1 response regulator transcription factor [Bacillota bacterium]MDY2920549.1 response regulator transcription factor [Lentihominibacter sp.]